MTIGNDLLEKFNHRNASVGVIGLGYVGLPLAVEFARAGFSTIGLDLDAQKVDTIRAGVSYIEDVRTTDLAAEVVAGRLTATTDFGALAACDAVSICVPTPLSKTHEPDLSYVIAAADAIAKYVHSGMLIVLESTTYPGTTEDVLVPRLIANGLRVGTDVFVAFSPERTDPGRADFTLRTTPKVIGGVTSECLEVARALYDSIVDTLVLVSSTAAAEMVKLLENTFRAVNIALVNEFLLMSDKLGINIWEVIEAAATKPYGFMKFTPGPGVGGHCIPLDPQYLSWKMRSLSYTARFIQLAEEVNAAMPVFWVDRVAAALNDARLPVNGSRVLVLGVTYKPNVADLRESPALEILRELQARGAEARFHDPYFTSLKAEGLETPFAELTETALSWADCVMIVSHHRAYDWAWIQRCARRVVDTRNVLREPREAHLPQVDSAPQRPETA